MNRLARHYLVNYEHTGTPGEPHARTWRCHCGCGNRCTDERQALAEWHNHAASPLDALSELSS